MYVFQIMHISNTTSNYLLLIPDPDNCFFFLFFLEKSVYLASYHQLYQSQLHYQPVADNGNLSR